ncbi:hypothetical protein CNE_1c11850 [Cupriavidus necator N-1]|uniref:Uncharacterized protein n=1 Tax=Cupriavidus necator (strain ATCC 43291 / DSM 13513 / CCUG 52238 / LMG 8453 / N-1) TaxID=1042878 RepID=G0ER22_CUPNN|nr:hypothetical protein [Cupriavidus necator]AEI76540.1 hypothetical protein CNE_1c11850 [Cupriavidus necator N-1]MDX6011337.1 hypothetical protein [Cupriavidus necator]
MLTVSVRHNIADVRKTLDNIAQKQMPFAIAKALTQTAKAVAGVESRALPRELDKPTPFTMRAFGTKPATKQRQIASVFIKPDQWKYLRYQVDGGERRPTKRAVVIPQGLRVNQYGNMPKGAIRKLLAKPGVFSGTVNGVPGIYQRKGRSVALLVKYVDKAGYKRRFDFAGIGQQAIAAEFGAIFGRALAGALATAR